LPTYEYRCLSCEHQFERFQRMSDEAVKECEVCGEPVKRLLFPVAVHFKGNGFYSTDYGRKNTMSSSGTSGTNGGGGEASGGGSDTSGGNGSSQAPDKRSGESAKTPVPTVRSTEPAAASAKND
jgi:putative FmdB family regulatory protein